MQKAKNKMKKCEKLKRTNTKYKKCKKCEKTKLKHNRCEKIKNAKKTYKEKKTYRVFIEIQTQCLGPLLFFF